MKKITLSLMLVFFVLFLFSCGVKPIEKEPWDDLGGGGSGEQTDESDISSDDVDKKEEVEDPDNDKFETLVDGAVLIDLDSLESNSGNYSYKDNIITVFILGVVVCSILEYITSYIMEKLFKTRWWDYSNKKFNLNGRICGKNCLLFGILGVLLIYIIHPIISKLITNIPFNILNIIALITLIIFIIDNIISFNVCSKFKKTLTSLDLKKDSTKEFTKAVKETLYNNQKILEEFIKGGYFERHLNKMRKRYRDKHD